MRLNQGLETLSGFEPWSLHQFARLKVKTLKVFRSFGIPAFSNPATILGNNNVPRRRSPKNNHSSPGEKMKRLLFLLLVLLFAACNGEDEDDEECNDPVGCDGQNPIVAVKIFGKAQKGPFLKNSEVTATAYNDNWDQSDFPKEGSTEHDDGSYQVYSEVTGPFVRMRIEGQSYNEVENRYDWVSLRDISRNSGIEKNINPLTNILDMVSIDHCRDSGHAYYRQGDNCLALGKSEILDYLGFQDYGLEFNEMSVQDSRTGDAVLFMVSSLVASGRTGPEQNDYMREISNGVLSNNLTLKQEISDFMWSMPFKKISDNLMNKYASLNVSAERPPFWSLPGVPDYYEILNRTPVILDSKNTGYTVTGVIDVADYDKFAYPVQLAAPNPKYIALNLENAKSIWSVKTHADGYLCPDAKVADLESMNEVLLENPVKLSYNYSVTGNLAAGQYLIYQEFDELTAPSKLIQGDMTPFGKSLASVDGINWIGWNNVTNWFTRSIKYYTTD